jgi:hypothetical protein
MMLMLVLLSHQHCGRPPEHHDTIQHLIMAADFRMVLLKTGIFTASGNLYTCLHDAQLAQFSRSVSSFADTLDTAALHHKIRSFFKWDTPSLELSLILQSL